jgi:L-malate glycosyltransferase
MPGPIPILLMVRELGPGGTERQLTETAKKLDRSLFAPHVGCFHDGGMRASELRDAGVPIVRFPVHSFGSLSALRGARQLGRYLKENHIQIVHTFDVPMNTFGVLASRLYRTPMVLSSQRAFRDLVSPAYRRLLRLTDRLADGIVVNCAAIREHLIADYGVPGSRIHLCYNGIDTSVFRGTHRVPKVAGSQVVIGGIYALRPEKNLETLVEAFAQVHARKPETRLLIVGSGSTEGLLRARAAALGVASSCRFEPASSDVVGWLGKIDIFVLPSSSEALSNSLMEAMACGCAVVASRIGGNPELIANNEIGRLFKAGDAQDLASHLETLASDEGLRYALGLAASARIRNEFSVDKAALRMGEIYLHLESRSRERAKPET